MKKTELLNKLRLIEGQLSPENLSRDGEASPAYVRREYARLTKEKAKIIKQLGYEPTFKELFYL